MKKSLTIVLVLAVMLAAANLAAAVPDGAEDGSEKAGIKGENGKPEGQEGHGDSHAEGASEGRPEAAGPPGFVEEVRQRGMTVIVRERVMIRGKPFESDLPPVIAQGRTLIPVRAFSEGLGADVEWHADEQKVTITRDEIEVELYIGKLIYYVDGEVRELDVEADILHNRTFVPLRFVSVALGEKVGYDPETGIITAGEA